ncbi:DUF488 domain-containing protein [Neorhizobium sp. Rsf11]|uniref:DUF488 domain-containing protein n=1 Tax=Neorhizobium phenanthreniclasticum TaxID=3157917 RepID=A0ABV0M6B1_9HYPH
MRHIESNMIWTIGHSTHSYEEFLSLLRRAGITAIADVRTAPYSRHFSQFNQDALKKELRLDGIAYSFLGDELGGRPKGSRYYCDGVADYEEMARADEFKKGLDRVMEGATKYRIALMCSEHDPLDCHRCLLVGRALDQRDVAVRHILTDGSIVSHREIEEKLLAITGSQNDDLFLLPKERLTNAYRRRSLKVAYAEPALASSA